MREILHKKVRACLRKFKQWARIIHHAGYNWYRWVCKGLTVFDIGEAVSEVEVFSWEVNTWEALLAKLIWNKSKLVSSDPPSFWWIRSACSTNGVEQVDLISPVVGVGGRGTLRSVNLYKPQYRIEKEVKCMHKRSLTIHISEQSNENKQKNFAFSPSTWWDQGRVPTLKRCPAKLSIAVQTCVQDDSTEWIEWCRSKDRPGLWRWILSLASKSTA